MDVGGKLLYIIAAAAAAELYLTSLAPYGLSTEKAHISVIMQN